MLGDGALPVRKKEMMNRNTLYLLPPQDDGKSGSRHCLSMSTPWEALVAGTREKKQGGLAQGEGMLPFTHIPVVPLWTKRCEGQGHGECQGK